MKRNSTIAILVLVVVIGVVGCQWVAQAIKLIDAKDKLLTQIKEAEMEYVRHEMWHTWYVVEDGYLDAFERGRFVEKLASLKMTRWNCDALAGRIFQAMFNRVGRRLHEEEGNSPSRERIFRVLKKDPSVRELMELSKKNHELFMMSVKVAEVTSLEEVKKINSDFHVLRRELDEQLTRTKNAKSEPGIAL